MKALSDSRILIVDDVKANVDVLVHALRDEYKLTVALDGEAALRAVAKSVPDLVLLDIMMPGIDGYEVCRRLRADESLRDLPIMFLSALEDVANKTAGFEAGGNDYLTKPFEVLEVKARARSLLKAKLYADAVREAAARDLRIAREIQMGVLPSDLPGCARGLPIEVAATVEPARAVGGDLYEVVRTADDRLMVALGDVSGKGIPASLFMTMAVTALRTLARELADPAEILRRLSNELADRNPHGMFVTMQCLVFDVTARQVSIAAAGHHALAVLSPGEAPRLAFSASGLPAGLMPGNRLTRETLPMSAGDTFVLFSDGVNEALDVHDDFFGDDRLLEVLAPLTGAPAPVVVAAVMDAVHAFAAGAPQSDDIAVLVARVLPDVAPGGHLGVQRESSPRTKYDR